MARVNRKIRKRDKYLIVQIYRICGYKNSVISQLTGYKESQTRDLLSYSGLFGSRSEKNKVYLEKWMSKKNLDTLLAELVEENTKALSLMAKQVQDPDWLSQQTGQNIGVLYDKISAINIRLLEAASNVERIIEDEHEQRYGKD